MREERRRIHIIAASCMIMGGYALLTFVLRFSPGLANHLSGLPGFCTLIRLQIYSQRKAEAVLTCKWIINSAAATNEKKTTIDRINIYLITLNLVHLIHPNR